MNNRHYVDLLLADTCGVGVLQSPGYSAALDRYNRPLSTTCITPDNEGGGGCGTEPTDTFIEDCTCAE